MQEVVALSYRDDGSLDVTVPVRRYVISMTNQLAVLF
jgi:hypothetical protein